MIDLHSQQDAVLRRPRSAIGHRHFTISRTPPPESLKAYAGHPEDAGKQPETQPVTLPAYIDDPVTKSQIRVPAHLEIGVRPDSLNTAAAQGLPYNVSYKIVVSLVTSRTRFNPSEATFGCRLARQ